MKALPPIELPNGRRIGYGYPCFIVAEIGQNHQGDVYTATRLMKAAHEAGVDAVKFCKRDIRSDLTQAAYDEPYLGPHSFGPTYGQHRKALELSVADYKHLVDRARYNKWPAVMFASACDQKSVDQLEATFIDPPIYKIASRDLDNLPLIDHVARLNKPIILSCGMRVDDGEIKDALKVITERHNKIVLLQCTSEYPTPPQHVALGEIRRLRDKFEVLTGLSDHTPGIVTAQAAPCLGAVVVEKHLTLSRAMKGRDHAASLEPQGMKLLVRNIRAVEITRQRHLQKDFPELYRMIPDPPAVDTVKQNRDRLGRSLVLRLPISSGEIITREMVCLKSPGTGIPWRDRQKVLGKTARRDIPADVTLQSDDVWSCQLSLRSSKTGIGRVVRWFQDH